MSIRNKLLGTWECLYYHAININDPNDIVHPYTEHVNGNIIYSSDGYMAAMLQRPNMPKYSPGPLTGSAEQYQTLGSSTQGYHGRFYFNEESAEVSSHDSDGKGLVKLTLQHNMIVSLPANWIGETQVRWCEMWEDERGALQMKLGPEFNIFVDDVERKIEVGWKKREPNTTSNPP